MSVKIIQDRLNQYDCKTSMEEENAIKEITQEIVLMALSRTDFFKKAEFHGGTALRILHGLERFSEDLYFALLLSDDFFSLDYYLIKIKDELDYYGYQLEVRAIGKEDKVVKTGLLKDNTLVQMLGLEHSNIALQRQKIRIKLEVDTHPPLGANTHIQYCDFPLSFAILAKDLPSSFSGKIHALLCRKYTKGRDWYDFIWYVSRKVPVNLNLLTNAIEQSGPWAQQCIQVTTLWMIEALKNKIRHIDWQHAKKDVEPFLRPQELLSLDVWSEPYFLALLDKLRNSLKTK